MEKEIKTPDMKYIMSHGMSDDTFVKTANKHFSGKGEVGKDGYSTQNKFTAELMRRQQSTGKDFEGKPLYKKVDKIQTNSYDPISNKDIIGISEKILKKNFNLGEEGYDIARDCLLYTSPSPRDTG